MTMRVLILSVLSILFLAQCKDKKKCASNDEITEEKMNDSDTGSADALIIGQAAYEGSAPITINNVSIKGDIMTFSVTHSGGCKDHTYELLFTGAYAKSLPVQAKFYLKHNSNGDFCKQLVQKEIMFDISEIKEKQDHVIISVMGYKTKIEYKSK